jgi:hypothetical protein
MALAVRDFLLLGVVGVIAIIIILSVSTSEPKSVVRFQNLGCFRAACIGAGCAYRNARAGCNSFSSRIGEPIPAVEIFQECYTELPRGAPFDA